MGGVAPWAAYDAKNKTEDVLMRYGWRMVGNDSQRVYMKRPGDTKAPHSGNVLLEKNLFHCWSSSTVFDPDKYYGASAVLCLLEYDGDWKKLANELYEKGYGKRPERTALHDLSSFIVSPNETNKLAELYNSGQIEESKGLGFEELDKFLVLRDKTFYTITGGKGSGKTTTLLYIFTIDAWVNKKKTLLVCYENDDFEVMSEVIGFLCHNNTKWVYQHQKAKYDKALKFFNDHFLVLKFPLEYDFLKICKAVREINAIKKFDRLFIDPLFRVPETDTYEKNRKVATYAKKFAEKELSLWVSMHPTGRAQRDGGQPRDLDAEFGGVYSNAADYTINMHRNYKDEDERVRRVVRVGIDKVRSKKLYGGNETFKNQEILFRLHPYSYGAYL
jgi:KaiC/GvpD/RAD55 family RecA-like ATPase